jgi:hypothetical protein
MLQTYRYGYKIYREEHYVAGIQVFPPAERYVAEYSYRIIPGYLYQ